MDSLRKFLRGCFANAAALYAVVSLSTVPTLFRASHPRAMAQFWHQNLGLRILAVLLLGLSDLIYLFPPILAVIFGFAWWTLKTGKPSARRWAIAGSIAMLISCAPLIPACYSMWSYRGYRSMAATVLIVALGCFAAGICGLIAFRKRNFQRSSAADSRPPRVGGDGTHKILDVLVLILQVGGVYALCELYMRWGHENGLSVSTGLESLFQFAVVIVAIIVIHEAAHAVVGWALGMKLGAFVVGPFHWRLLDGRWSFQFRPDQFLAFSGAAGLIPTNPDESRWNEVSMIAAGPLSNLLTGIVAAAFAYSAIDKPWQPFWEYFALFAAISVVTSIVNLIPFRPDSLYSDGARIYQLFRGGPVADYQRAVKTVLSTVVSPRRPKDYDIGAIQRASAHFTSGQTALLLRLWAKTYYVDTGDLRGASSELAEAERIYHESASDIPAELLSIFVINSVVLRHDAAAAHEWWERLEAKKPRRFNADYWLATCAHCWANNDSSGAREAWATGSDYLNNLPLTGTYNFDRSLYGRMKELLDESAPANVPIFARFNSDSPRASEIVPLPIAD